MNSTATTKKKNLFLLAFLLILIGYTGAHYQMLAEYFLKNQVFFSIVIPCVIISSSLLVKFIHNKLDLIAFSHSGHLSILIGIFTVFSFQFIYFLRPYTQYISLIIYISCAIIGLFAGVTSSHLYGQSKKNNRSGWIIYSAMVLFLLLGYILPLLPSPGIVIGVIAVLFIAGGIVMSGTRTLSVKSRKWLWLEGFAGTGMIITTILIYIPIVLFGVQDKFEDKVIYTSDTGKKEVTITKWKDHYWIYHDGLKHLSTIDDYLFYEPFILPAGGLISDLNHVLILGGENGCAIREILKFKNVDQITVIPYDQDFLILCREHPVLTELNNDAFLKDKVRVLNLDILEFITSSDETFDLLILDLPDPRDIESNQLYTKEFYGFCINLISPYGLIVTQSGSPYFTSEAFHSIGNTMKSAGLNIVPLHNQVLTLGEWSWTIGSKDITSYEIKAKIKNLGIEHIPTEWLNKEALSLITSFGKEYKKIDSVEINTLNNPVAYRYYLEGTWDFD